MLQTLAIRDIVLIERLEVGFAPGLTVLTGETGAGKSILLDALSLALGGRGDAGLVRHGAPQGQVTAVFDLAAGNCLAEIHPVVDENAFLIGVLLRGRDLGARSPRRVTQRPSVG